MFAVGLSLLGTSALAQDYRAVTIADAALRQAPGEQYASVGVVPRGTALAVDICFDRGSYCAVSFAGGTGFVAGTLLATGNSGETVKAIEAARWAEIDARSATARLPDNEGRSIVVWGDSLSTNTFGDELEDLLLGRDVSMQGVPGEDGKAIADRMLADTRFSQRIKVIWDRHYSGERAADYMAAIAPMVEKAAQSGPFVVVSDVPDLDGTDTVDAPADASETDTINTALRAKYPGNYLDMTAPLANPATRTDGLHLSAAGEAAVAKTIAAYVRQQDW